MCGFLYKFYASFFNYLETGCGTRSAITNRQWPPQEVFYKPVVGQTDCDLEVISDLGVTHDVYLVVGYGQWPCVGMLTGHG